MKTFAFSIFLLVLFTGIASGQFDYGFDFTKSGTSGYQFLKIGVGPAYTAIGDAATATANDAAGVFWNIAGIGWMEESELYVSQNDWLVGSKHNAASAAFPLGSFVLSANLISLSIESFEETTVLEPLGTGRMVDAGDFLFGLGVARKFTERLTLGAQAKFVQEKLDDVTFSNTLFDVGAIYYTGYRDLKIGFTFQHFGPDKIVFDQKFKMPLLFRVGVADMLLRSEDFELLTSVDLVHPTDNQEWLNWGVEATLMRALILRGGYRFNVDEGELNLGFGIVSPRLSFMKPRFDYAYNSFGDILGDIHRVALTFSF